MSVTDYHMIRNKLKAALKNRLMWEIYRKEWIDDETVTIIAHTTNLDRRT